MDVIDCIFSGASFAWGEILTKIKNYWMNQVLSVQ